MKTQAISPREVSKIIKVMQMPLEEAPEITVAVMQRTKKKRGELERGLK
jgi:hypothetical protein